MTTRTGSRLLVLGALWGLVLAVVPAFVMTEPYRLTGFLVAALVCAVLSGGVGTLMAGRWAAKGAYRPQNDTARRSGLLAGIVTGAVQGIVGGGVAALLFWGLMAVSISGITLQNPIELSVLMEPTVFLGSFFVALSVFLYALVGGLLLSPVFGTLVNRAVRTGSVAGKDAGDDAGGKEDLVVR
jgi:hypothetical protein